MKGSAMGAKEVFSDKPIIIAAIEAFEKNAQSARPAQAVGVGGVCFGRPEGPRYPLILVQAYRRAERMGGPMEDGLVARKRILEETHTANERVPAQSPLDSFEELAEQRQNGKLTDEEMKLLEDACAYIPGFLNEKSIFDPGGEDAKEETL